MDVSPAGVTPAANPSSLAVVSQPFDVVLASFEARIKVLARRHSHRPFDRDELIQVGRIALWKAYRTYDVTRGHPLENYASRAIARAMRREMRREQRHWNNRVTAPPDTADDDVLASALDQQAGDIARAQEDAPGYWNVLHDHVRVRIKQLPVPLRLTFELRHVQGLTQPAAAKLLNVSQQRISQLERQLSRALCYEA